MPSRWVVPLSGLDPALPVAAHHLHAAVSQWFDLNDPEHRGLVKPWVISPVVGVEPGVHRGCDPQGPVVEVGTLTDEAERRLLSAVGGGARLVLGRQRVAAGEPLLLARSSWRTLVRPAETRRWRLDFVTPTTFTSGRHTSPLPSVRGVLRGLAAAWLHWSGGVWRPLPQGQDDPLAVARMSAGVFVTDVDLQTEVSRFDVHGHEKVVSGCVGSIVVRCSDSESANVVAPLVRLSTYAGVGGFTTHGCGVTRCRPWREGGFAPSDLWVGGAAEDLPG